MTFEDMDIAAELKQIAAEIHKSDTAMFLLICAAVITILIMVICAIS